MIRVTPPGVLHFGLSLRPWKVVCFVCGATAQGRSLTRRQARRALSKLHWYRGKDGLLCPWCSPIRREL